MGLGERRYANYVSGKREPDLATFVRIAEVLGTTPNWLLGREDNDGPKSVSSILLDRLAIAANAMTKVALEITVTQAEAVASRREPK